MKNKLMRLLVSRKTYMSVISILLVIVFAFNYLPQQAIAEAISGAREFEAVEVEDVDDESVSEQSEDAIAEDDAYILCEDTTARTETSKQFRMSDGTII